MWHNFIESFWVGLIGASVPGVIFWLAGHRRRFSETLSTVFMFALVISVPQIVFGYFPQIRESWCRFAVSIGVALVISLPFIFVVQRLRRKDSHDA